MENLVTVPLPPANAYAPRDVVNAPALKAAIAERSRLRADPPEIAAWLLNHWYRHLVGNLQADPPAVVPITSAAQLQTLCGSQPLPTWALQRLEQLDQGLPLAPLWWVQPDSRSALRLETRLLEFLHSRQGTALQGKLQRINCPQALARWTLEHLEFERQRNAGRQLHQPQAVHPILTGPSGMFVELDGRSPVLRQEMAYESQMMGHCLGQFARRDRLSGGYGEHYAKDCEQGRMRLFSLRTGVAQPRITINAYVQADGRLEVEQIKGKQNQPPIARYTADVVGLLNHLPLNASIPEDALAMGLVRRPPALLDAEALESPWCHVSALHSEAEQLWLLQTHPQLLHQLTAALLPIIQWLLLARSEPVPGPWPPGLQQAQALASPQRTGT